MNQIDLELKTHEEGHELLFYKIKGTIVKFKISIPNPQENLSYQGTNHGLSSAPKACYIVTVMYHVH